MNFTAIIDNVTASQWGLNVQQAYAFSWVYQLASWAFSTPHNGDIYFHAERSKFIEDMPLLTNRQDTVYRTLKEFVDFGLIKMEKIGRKDFICLTEKGKNWGRQEVGKKSDLDETRKNFRDNSEKNPNDTIYNHNTKDHILPDIEKSSSQIPDEGKKKLAPKKKESVASEDGQKFATWYSEKMKPVSMKPDEKDLLNWGLTYDSLIRLKYSKDQIINAVRWGRTDEFWKGNFQSPVKLMKKNDDDVRYIDVFLDKANKIKPVDSDMPAQKMKYNPVVGMIPDND
jgi:hypothetical protein